MSWIGIDDTIIVRPGSCINLVLPFVKRQSGVYDGKEYDKKLGKEQLIKWVQRELESKWFVQTSGTVDDTINKLKDEGVNNSEFNMEWDEIGFAFHGSLGGKSLNSPDGKRTFPMEETVNSVGNYLNKYPRFVVVGCFWKNNWTDKPYATINLLPLRVVLKPKTKQLIIIPFSISKGGSDHLIINDGERPEQYTAQNNKYEPIE